MKAFLRNLILLILFSCLIFALLQKTNKKEIVYEDEGIEYLELSKSELVVKAQHNYIFSLNNANTDYYKIISKHVSNKPSTVYKYLVNEQESGALASFAKIYKNKIPVADTLYLSYYDLRDLVTSSEGFKAVEVENGADGNGFLAMLEESVLIFLLISLVLFGIRLFYELCRFFYFSVFKTSNYLFLDATFLLLALFYILGYTTPDSYCANKLSVFIQLSLVVFPVYFIVQYFKSKEFDKLKMEDRIIIRFLIIFFSTVVFIFISTEIARFIDLNIFNGSDFSGLVARARTEMSIGFAYAYSVADFFLVSLRRMMITKRVDPLNN